MVAQKLRGSFIELAPPPVDDLMKLRRAELLEPMEWMTCRPVVFRTDEEAAARMEAVLQDAALCLWGIYDLKSKGVLGKVTAFDHNPRNRSMEVGYYLCPEYRGNGIMNEAMTLALGWLFSQGVNKIYAQTGSFNEASARLLERLGFHQDGRLRQHHELDGILYDDLVYSLLKSEFNI